MFFRIKEDRFKSSSVTRYFKGKKSPCTNKWYITIFFGKIEKLFPFDTEKEMNDVIDYLDEIFKVKPI